MRYGCTLQFQKKLFHFAAQDYCSHLLRCFFTARIRRMMESNNFSLFVSSHPGRSPHLHPIILPTTGPKPFLGKGYPSLWSHVLLQRHPSFWSHVLSHRLSGRGGGFQHRAPLPGTGVTTPPSPGLVTMQAVCLLRFPA